jgi:deoxyribonuclease (pyrimidine dimer)
MTRINVVPVESLCRQHLIAEWRELPRVFALACKASISPKPWTDKQPAEYTLGTGHVIFFYDKLAFLADRHQQLTQEMLRRGYKPSVLGSLYREWKLKIPQTYWKDYTPTEQALSANAERIAERTPK